MTSPIFQAFEKIVDLFDLQTVDLFSYKDDFARLWDGSFVSPGQKILCVIDDHESPPQWLSLGLWSAWFRSRDAHPPPVVIIGRKKESFHSPVFFNSLKSPGFEKLVGDEGISPVYLESPNLLADFLQAVEIFSEFLRPDSQPLPGPDVDMVQSWKGLVFARLSAPGTRHAASNEIAPMVLRDSLLSLNLKDEMPGHIAGALETLRGEVPVDGERAALLCLWKWATGFLSSPGGSAGEDGRPQFKRWDDLQWNDVWGVAGQARFLMVDDQAKTHHYEDIVRCALEIVLGRESDGWKLESRPNISPGEIESLLDVPPFGGDDRCNCLFLDLRLEEKDQGKTDFAELSGVKMALAVSRKDASFPIIIFSSSQQREIDRIFSRYKNIITVFRKPGIAGPSSALANGQESLALLFTAIGRALEMLENRMVYKKMMALPESEGATFMGGFRLSNPRTGGESILSKTTFKGLFRQVFLDGRYDLAFLFPCNFFEWLFQINRRENEFRESKKTSFQSDKLEPGTQYAIKGAGEVLLKDFKLLGNKESTFRLSVLSSFRNLAAHGIRSYSKMRREAVLVLLLFMDTLLLPKEKDNSLRPPDIQDGLNPGEIKLTIEGKKNFVRFPLSSFYYAGHDNLKELACEIFAAFCYYSGASDREINRLIYQYWMVVHKKAKNIK